MAITTVRIKPKTVPVRDPPTKAWWAYVTVQPDVSSRIVFNRGNTVASRAVIPAGGHTTANSRVGAKAEWKYAQNREKNTRTSVVTKRVIP